MEKDKLDVAVWMVTYNHEKFISQAIESILMQRTKYAYRIFIGEDFSKDKTREICIDYASRFPDKIQLILRDANVGYYTNAVEVYQACIDSGARYMALLEGDDAWLGSDKIEAQVDFLDRHPNYSFVTSGYIQKETTTGEEKIVVKNADDDNAAGFDITIDRFLRQWSTNTLTMMLKTSAFNIGIMSKYKYTRDVHLYYWLLQSGIGFYMSKALGLYRRHDGGIFSQIGEQNKQKGYYLVYEELYENHPKDFRQKFYRVIFNLLAYEKQHGKISGIPAKSKLIKRLIRLSENEEEFLGALALKEFKNPRIYSISLRMAKLFGKIK